MLKRLGRTSTPRSAAKRVTIRPGIRSAEKLLSRERLGSCRLVWRSAQNPNMLVSLSVSHAVQADLHWVIDTHKQRWRERQLREQLIEKILLDNAPEEGERSAEHKRISEKIFGTCKPVQHSKKNKHCWKKKKTLSFPCSSLQAFSSCSSLRLQAFSSRSSLQAFSSGVLLHVKQNASCLADSLRTKF